MPFHEPSSVSPWSAVVAGLLTLLGAILWLLEVSLGTPLMMIAAAMMGYMAWRMERQ